LSVRMAYVVADEDAVTAFLGCIPT
jgi:hypothetical protein